METPREISSNEPKIALQIGMVAVFTALGVVLSGFNPFAYMVEILGTKINPFVHLINAITGVLLGPVYAILIALFIAIIRFSLNIGTIHAFHGGMTGALIVGVVAILLTKKNVKFRKYATLFEPFGTIFIGGTITAIILGFGIPFYHWGLFAMSCVPGAIVGYLIIEILHSQNITYLNFK